MSPQDSMSVPSEPMNCMEVWGGSCTRDDCLRRPGLDIWIQSQRSEFADAGGGDLHLLSSCASGRITRLLLADICGIGSLFSEISGELRDLMKRNVNTIQQQRIVRDMSHRLEQASRKGGFASILVSTFFAPTRSFSMCNTGHPPPLVFRKQDGGWMPLKHSPSNAAMQSAFGGAVNPDEYQRIKTSLDVGDMVLCYSNVLTECRSADGQIIGLQGVLDRVRGLDTEKPEQLAATLISKLQAEHADNREVEEATVLLCQATATKVGWKDNLLAPLRLFGSVSDNADIE